MLRTTFIALVLLILSALAFSQSDDGEALRLSKQIAELYQQGKLDEAIPLAESVVKIQRRDTSSTRNLISALENLAQIRLIKFKLEMAELNSPETTANRAGQVLIKMRSDAQESEKSLREALKLARAESEVSPNQNLSIRNNLAWLLYNHTPSDPKIFVGFDKDSRDKFEMQAKASFLKRRNEAEILYKEALAIAETDKSAESDAATLALFNLAEFELAMGEIEAAIADYQKCISAVEKKYGKTSKNLLMPLESYLKALTATFQEDLAYETISRIVRISGKSMQYPKTLLNLSLRTDKAFMPSNASGVTQNARANKEKVDLLGRQAVVTRDIGPAGRLAVSTLGREYYGNSGDINIRKVLVRVLIDETGKVVEAEGMTSDAENKPVAEKVVREWTFRPFVVGTHSAKIQGYVECLLLADQT